MSEEKEKFHNGLSPESTLKELFDFIRVEEGVNVMPVTLDQDPKDTRMMILIQGEHETASVIMAKLMTVVTDLFDTEKQREQDDKPRIVLPRM